MFFPVRTFLNQLSQRSRARLADLIHTYGKASYHTLDNYSPSPAGDAPPLIVLELPFTNDAQTVAHLMAVRRGLERHQRVAVTSGSVYFFRLVRWLSPFSRTVGDLPHPQFSSRHFQRLVRSTGFEVTREEPLVFFPFLFGTWGSRLDRFLCALPLIRHFAIARLTYLRPYHPTAALKADLSLIVPLRNEKGNLPGIFEDIAEVAPILHEVIFVEGNSTDGTWEALKQAAADYRGPAKLQLHQQTGKGKKDAVRLALGKVTADLIAIYDADRTVSAKELLRFHEAYHQGKGDFINGSRLKRPMESGAMRPLNKLGNHFFARLLSFALDLPLSDSLCGTKLFSKKQYERMKRWNERYPDFDPFGDFELLFPAAALAIGAYEVEVSYLARRYGETNIHRFRDGWLLLKMSLFGVWRIRLGFLPRSYQEERKLFQSKAA